MNAKSFQEKNEARWQELELLLNRLDGKAATPEDASRLPERFRQISSDLALAQHRMYGLGLCERLNRLVIRCYNHMHEDRSNVLESIGDFFGRQLPRTIRAEWKLFWVAMAFFWIPFWSMYASGYVDPTWIQAVLGPEGMSQLENSFSEGETLSEGRTLGTNFYMFTFYINNNIGIDLRTFAGGALAGVGTLFFLLFNGVVVGAQFGFAYQACDPMIFTTWFCSHAFPEAVGMILSSMAGFKIGYAMIRPGRRPRKEALKRVLKPSVNLIFGAVAMTFLAAIIEGFWSPLPIPHPAKWLFAAALVLGLSAYMLFSGRAGHET